MCPTRAIQIHEGNRQHALACCVGLERHQTQTQSINQSKFSKNHTRAQESKPHPSTTTRTGNPPPPIHRRHQNLCKLYVPHCNTTDSDDDYLPPRDTSPHQDNAGTTPGGTPPPAQPPPPPQTRRTQSHRAPTPIKRLATYSLAFTQYWYYQYCMVYGIPKGARRGLVYCPIAVQKYCNSMSNAGALEEREDD